MKRSKILYILTPLLFMAGIAIGVLIGASFKKQVAAGDLPEKYQQILDLISNEYVDDISVDSLLEMNIPDLLSYLDPHSAYIPATDFEDVNSELEGSFSGVGISFQIMKDTVVAVEIIAGGPAQKVGMLPGDRILMADTVTLTGKGATQENVFKNLRGKKGSNVSLKVLRPGMAKPVVYDVIRGDIPVNSVDAAYLIDPKTGYIRVGKFARNTYQEFLDALLKLRMQGAEKMVIDLRGNTGGYMDQAINMANEFLPCGRRIVYTKGRHKADDVVANSDGRGSFQDMQLVVVVDEISASASEIFAGAIQDNDRGLVIGRRTFGKGLVQNQFMLPDNSAIRLTVARYYTPSGRSIQKIYERGDGGKYEMDLLERYAHGEFYNADSIHLDKSKKFKTVGGRIVYGGGGIMPDIFVPGDTVGVTSYYTEVSNSGLIPRFSMQLADRYRKAMGNSKDMEKLLRSLPNDNALLQQFVNYAAAEGVPARWYYINQSRALLLRQIKAVLVRDILGFDNYFRFINREDNMIQRAVKELQAGHSPIQLRK